MKIKHFLLNFLFALIFVNIGYCQDAVVLVNNSPYSKSTILIKWLSPSLIYNQGVNIYRKEQNTDIWVKLNQTPITLASNDNDLPTIDEKKLFSLVQNAKKEPLEGIIKLVVLTNMILSNQFANHCGIFFKDTTAIIGKKYQYKIQVINDQSEILLASSSWVTCSSFQPINPPDSISYEAINKICHFKWKLEPTRFFAVNIYRKNALKNQFEKINQEPLLVAESADSSGKLIKPEYYYSDTGLVDGVPYYYILKAVDFFGFESLSSNEIKVISLDKTPPFPPFGLKCDLKKYALYLKWAYRPIEPDFIGFNVYRSTNPDANYKKINKLMLLPGDTLFKDSVNTHGDYYYVVAAVDKSGNEGYSNIMMVKVKDVFPPAIPKNLIAKADTGVIRLKWTANREKDLYGYLVYRNIKSAPDEEFQLLISTPITTNFYDDKLPRMAKNTFFYKIKAVDSSFNLSEFSNCTSAKMPDAFAPDKPFIKEVVAADSGVVVKWISNIEDDLAGYNLYRMDSNSIKPLKINSKLIDKKVNFFLDKPVKDFCKYEYFLVALDSNGNQSAPSERYPVFVSKKYQSSNVIKFFNVKQLKSDNKIEIKWEIHSNLHCQGCILFKSDSSLLFLPISGMLRENKKSWIEKYDLNNTFYYQLRCYFLDGFVEKSEVLKFYKN